MYTSEQSTSSFLFLQSYLVLETGFTSQGCSYWMAVEPHPNFMFAELAPQNETVCGDGGYK